MIKQSPGGQELSRADIKQLLYLLVDVVVQFGMENHHRFIREIWYDPRRKRRALATSE
jgi:type IV secretion system protein VirB11